MKFLIPLLLLFVSCTGCASENPLQANQENYGKQQVIERVYELASHCVHNEEPNFVENAKSVHKAFYGCFDWHSAVHSHWVLARILHLDLLPGHQDEIVALLNQSFTKENIAAEVEAFRSDKFRFNYELPYGFSWYLTLTAELVEINTEQSRQWLQTLSPLTHLIEDRMLTWLYYNRKANNWGTHYNTVFSLNLLSDWASVVGNTRAQYAIKRWSGSIKKEQACDIAKEPFSSDFISPCLVKADFMRRNLEGEAYQQWLKEFLPNIPTEDGNEWLEVQYNATADTHLFGLNLSRAWMLKGIASALPDDDKRKATLQQLADAHTRGGIGIVMKDLDYMGSHWLGTFTLYLLTDRDL